ncbi:HAD family hydrolase [Paenibacillus aceris]|uniref:Hydrolase of the HAD superfamily n=1 Tax=Paenibacillus aceris TaxID=869555 RepID=A0ABS4I8R5_9BACL|nr:HAD family hydrolase [Paenibacillus aceris]MBP1967070.1 putative hydrolase of the HAD superfamily [Paenibacillus aceris]NHW33267.1 HAD family hydrolase [Paenibacillus aceris]
MTINALVFDMDDTLYEEKDYVKSGFKALDQWVIKEFKIKGFYETALDLFLTGERKLLFNKTLDKLNIIYNDSMIKSMVESYRSHEPDIQLLEDAKWIFENLRDTVKVGLISDGYLVAQEKKVNALKLQEKLQTIILTDRLGREHWKPSHVPYEYACQELQLPHDQCVYIGDNINKDFVTAKKLGWTTIQIERNDGIYSGITAEQEYRAHFKIDNLRKLPDLPMLKHMFA